MLPDTSVYPLHAVAVAPDSLNIERTLCILLGSVKGDTYKR